LATWENYFEPEFGRLCAGFLAGAFFFFRNNTHLNFHTYLNDFMRKFRNLSQNGYGPDIIQHGHA
jgi:hypothetical protein